MTNPYMRLRDQVAEPLANFGIAQGSEISDRVATLFDRVELPRSFMTRFPHELSGGQRQRVGVMYLGRLVEIGSRAQVMENPQQKYTRSLLSAVPIADPSRRMMRDDVNFRPIPSPVFPLGHEPGPSLYDEVAPGHLVLCNAKA